MSDARRHRHGSAGLTLIELVIGLGICALLVSLAVPSFSAHLQRQRLKAAALGLETDLHEARYEAVRRGRSMHVTFSPGVDWCYAVATSADCDCRIAQPCRVKAVRATDLRGVHLLESSAAGFDPATGNTEQAGATATWQVPNGETVRVSLTPLGRTQVCVASGTLAPLPGC